MLTVPTHGNFTNDSSYQAGSGKKDAIFSLAHLTLIGCSVPELVFVAARAGYDAVSPRFIPMGIPGEFCNYPNDKELVHATKTALNLTGIAVHEVELARIMPDCEPKSFVPAMEVGADLGANRFILSAWMGDNYDRNFVIDCYAEACDLAKPFNLTVDFEFPTFSSVSSLKEAVDIVRSADRSNCGILIDTIYAYFTELDPCELDTLPPEWFHFLHISDSPPIWSSSDEEMLYIARDGRLYPGEGCIDFNSLVKHLPEMTYTIELPNKKRVNELGYEEHVRRALTFAKQALASSHPMHGSGSNYLTQK